MAPSAPITFGAGVRRLTTEVYDPDLNPIGEAEDAMVFAIQCTAAALVVGIALLLVVAAAFAVATRRRARLAVRLAAQASAADRRHRGEREVDDGATSAPRDRRSHHDSAPRSRGCSPQRCRKASTSAQSGASECGGAGGGGEGAGSSVPLRSRRVVFLHPDLGIGGAERLVVDAAVGLRRLGVQVTIVTPHHDPARCFPETVDGTVPVIVAGSAFPRHIFGRAHVLCATIRMALAALWLSCLGPLCDTVIVDQVAAAMPVLRLLGPARPIVFYCHHPDQLCDPNRIAGRRPGGAMMLPLYTAYRRLFDGLEAWTMRAATTIVVNSDFTRVVTERVFPFLAPLAHPAAVRPLSRQEQTALIARKKSAAASGGDSGLCAAGRPGGANGAPPPLGGSAAHASLRRAAARAGQFGGGPGVNYSAMPVLYPPVHLAALDRPPPPAAADAAAAALQTELRGRTVVVSLNRYERKKNVALAVRAFARCLRMAAGLPNKLARGDATPSAAGAAAASDASATGFLGDCIRTASGSLTPPAAVVGGTGPDAGGGGRLEDSLRPQSSSIRAAAGVTGGGSSSCTPSNAAVAAAAATAAVSASSQPPQPPGGAAPAAFGADGGGSTADAEAVAMAAAAARGKLVLVVAGGYDPRLPENVEHKAELEHLAFEELRLPRAAVRFLTSITDGQKRVLLGAAAVVVYTPSGEHFGIVPVEAMALRVPVLAVADGGPLESVGDDGTCGLLRPPTTAAFGDALDALLLAPGAAEGRAAMGAAGRARVVSRFSAEAFAAELDRCCADALASLAELDRSV